MKKEYLFGKEHFKKWAECSIYDLSMGTGGLSQLFDHGFIADRACVWGGDDLEGHELAIISRTYCSNDEISKPPEGLRCIRLPDCIMGKDDQGIAIATVIDIPSVWANHYLSYCRYLPVNMLAFAIPLHLQYSYKMLIGTHNGNATVSLVSFLI